MTDGHLDFAITDVRAVLSDRMVDDATVLVRDGRIADIAGPAAAAPPGAIRGGGAFLLPGVVCTHSDGVEREIWPRPNTRFPVDFALRSFEGRLRAAGVTTVFHGVGFGDQATYDRTVEQALEVCDVLVARRASITAPAEHLVLHRMEARSDRGWAELVDRLPQSEGLGHRPLVSFEDHSPGQGQFRDVEKFKRSFDAAKLPAGETVEGIVARRLAEAQAAASLRERNLASVVEMARSGRIRLLAHDLEDGGQVLEAVTWGATVAEFPLTKDAASEAARQGMAVVMGAPNVLRGGSHSGNVAAAELVAAGLCTSLASDYQPSTMLAAAFRLVDDGLCSVPEAVALVTSGPAKVAGLADRGRLEVGLRGDMTLVELDGRWPRVRATMRGSAPVPALVGR